MYSSFHLMQRYSCCLCCWMISAGSSWRYNRTSDPGYRSVEHLPECVLMKWPPEHVSALTHPPEIPTLGSPVTALHCDLFRWDMPSSLNQLYGTVAKSERWTGPGRWIRPGWWLALVHSRMWEETQNHTAVFNQQTPTQTSHHSSVCVLSERRRICWTDALCWTKVWPAVCWNRSEQTLVRVLKHV